MRRVVAAALLVLSCGCRRGEAPDAAPAIDATPAGEISIPAPAATLGEVVEWRRDTVITAKARLYRDQKWQGNVQVVGARQSRIGVETLALAGAQPARLRLRYLGYRSTVSIGGVERLDGPSFEGKAYEAEIAGTEVKISPVGGGGLSAAEVDRVGRDVNDLVLMWRAVQGRKLKMGEAVVVDRPSRPTLMLEGARGGAAVLAVKVASPLELPVGLEMDATLHGQALLDLGSGRLREVRIEGAGNFTTGKVDRKGDMVLAGSAEYVQTDVVGDPKKPESGKP